MKIKEDKGTSAYCGALYRGYRKGWKQAKLEESRVHEPTRRIGSLFVSFVRVRARGMVAVFVFVVESLVILP